MSRASRRGDRGMVTAEAAVVLPVLVVVLVMAVWLVACLSAQLRCVDSARAAARLAARGETTSLVEAAAREGAPTGARVAVTQSGERVTVVVESEISPFGGVLDRLPGILVHGRATALVEEALSGPSGRGTVALLGAPPAGHEPAGGPP